MLKLIFIKNYAIVDEVTIDLSDGLSIITGETGAGKSILIGALNALFGGRTSPNVIREGSKKSIIEGAFAVNASIAAFCERNDIECEDDLVLLRREIWAAMRVSPDCGLESRLTTAYSEKEGHSTQHPELDPRRS